MATDVNHRQLRALSLGALGVVFGDIGTNPLFAFKEVFGGAHHPVAITHGNVLGILSTAFWALMIVVTVKYVSFVLRADNKGEGGIMALMALALRNIEKGSRRRTILVALGLAGAALFYGDSVVTPAISVISAIEGLGIATPVLKPFVIPLTLVVLIALFTLQRRGTDSIGVLFGPVMLTWFIVLGLLGLINIAKYPIVLYALNPAYVVTFFAEHPNVAFFSLGAIVLVVNGAEALYADIGHFGVKPIRVAWFAVALPSLALNYFGQGGLLLTDPSAVENPFFLLAPKWALYPLVALATAAAVIASQSVISGAFSMTQQAIQLGYSPRLEVQHTSESTIGQIYLPAINWLLLLTVAGLVIGFGSSSKLAAAYGIAVTGTMLITNLLAYAVAVWLWRWNWVLAACGVLPFLLIDLGFFSANFFKLADGGWFPLAFGLIVFTVMTTWRQGSRLLADSARSDAIPFPMFVEDIAVNGLGRVPGTAVFMTQDTTHVPFALLHSLKHYKVLHTRNIFVTVIVQDIPHVDAALRVAVENLSGGFFRITVFFGFSDTPDLPAALELCATHGLDFDLMDTSFFLGRETVITSISAKMSRWRLLLFAALFRNAGSATAFFQIPPNRVVELGTQVVM